MPVSGVKHFLPPGPLYIFLHGWEYTYWGREYTDWGWEYTGLGREYTDWVESTLTGVDKQIVANNNSQNIETI